MKILVNADVRMVGLDLHVQTVTDVSTTLMVTTETRSVLFALTEELSVEEMIAENATETQETVNVDQDRTVLHVVVMDTNEQQLIIPQHFLRDRRHRPRRRPLLITFKYGRSLLESSLFFALFSSLLLSFSLLRSHREEPVKKRLKICGR